MFGTNTVWARRVVARTRRRKPRPALALVLAGVTVMFLAQDPGLARYHRELFAISVLLVLAAIVFAIGRTLVRCLRRRANNRTIFQDHPSPIDY